MLSWNIAFLRNSDTIFMCNHTNTSWKIYISFQCCCHHNPDYRFFTLLCLPISFLSFLFLSRFGSRSVCIFFFVDWIKLFEFCTNVNFSFNSSDIVYVSLILSILWCIYKFNNNSFCLSISCTLLFYQSIHRFLNVLVCRFYKPGLIVIQKLWWNAYNWKLDRKHSIFLAQTQ